MRDIDNAKLYSQDMEDIRWKRMILQDIRAGNQYAYVSEEINAGGGYKVKLWRRNGEPIAKPRGFYLAGDNSMKWYWIDLENEWP
jgi:hypothetical protein